MKRALFDTNIILDIALKRPPHFELASDLFELIDEKEISGHVSASTISDIYYISRKEKGHQATIDFISDLIEIMDIVGVDRDTIIQALKIGLNDFEDANQVSAAHYHNLDCIITRNKKDFMKSGFNAYEPGEFLKLIR